MSDESTSDRTQIQSAAPTVSAESARNFPAIPGYQILRELGRGGMGIVYEAKHLSLDRIVAIKLMKNDEPLNKARFLAEGQVIAAVKHPNVVEVYDFGESDIGPFIAMEFLTGGSLKSGSPLPPREAAETVAKIASGVGAAHDLGIVHRDLKPGNVLLDANGQPKVTDFGLAKRTASELTQTQDAAGTPAYMAPEQAKAMKFVGPQADVWSLGVMLYESLTGRRPFAAETDVQLLIKIQSDDPPTLRTITKGIPSDLETICLKCLEKEPERRYGTANEMADDLWAWIEGKPIAARRATPIERAMLWARRKPSVAASWALGFVSAIACIATVIVIEAWQATRAAHKREIEANNNLVAQNERVERIVYARTIDLAHREVLQGSIRRANLYLAACLPQYRSWEWNLVDKMSKREQVSDVLNRVKISFPRHPKRVFQNGFNHDGTRIATICEDGKVRIFEVDPIRQVDVIEFADRFLTTVRFSPDGSRLICGTEENESLIWHLASRKIIFRLIGHSGPIRSAHFSLDGTRLATASWDGTAIIWNANTGERIQTLVGHSGKLNTIRWSHDGTRLITGGWDCRAILWNSITGEMLREFGKWNEHIATVAFSPDDRLAVICPLNQPPSVWDTESGQMSYELRGQFYEKTLSATFHPDGKRIVTGADGGIIKVWDAATGTEMISLGKLSHGHVHAVSFDSTGQLLLASDYLGDVYLYDSRSTSNGIQR